MADEPKNNDASIEFHAVIDRIEDGDWAVLLIGDEEKMGVDLPRSFLPEAAADGDHLRINITIDEASRRAAEDQIGDTLERLKKRSSSTPGKKNFKL